MALVASCAGLLAGIGYAYTQLPSWAAAGLLHPARHVAAGPAPPGCRDETFTGEDVTLRGWRCEPAGPLRGTLIYLHGVADNHGSASGAIERLRSRNLEIIAYDSRAHGASEGLACTYGYFEKADLRRVIDALAPGPVVLLGVSLGAAVALQEAAADDRITGVVAVDTFADLRTVATHRAPRYLTHALIQRAFEEAERAGHFRVDAVSPVEAARRIRVPVLLIHGAADRETPPDGSRLVFEALAGPRQLLLIPGAGHTRSLQSDRAWHVIDGWLERMIAVNPRTENP